MVVTKRCLWAALGALLVLGALCASAIAQPIPDPSEDRASFTNPSGEQGAGAFVATGSDPSGRELFNVVYWGPARGAEGYNLYRRRRGVLAFPAEPLNGRTPIRLASSCNELRELLNEDVFDWRAMAEALEVRNLCAAAGAGFTKEQIDRIGTLAFAHLGFRLVRGWAFVDKEDLRANEWYVYELRGVARDGREFVVATDILVQAGRFVRPTPPVNVSLLPGDHEFLILWKRNPRAYGFDVRRATSASGPFVVVNDAPVIYDVTQDLNGEDIPPRPGFSDFQRWDADGKPTTHDVDGTNVTGPDNYVTYYYQIASRDILGRRGNWSDTVSGKATDQTPPSAALDVKVEPVTGGLQVSWRKSIFDAKGHAELETSQTAQIYRSDSFDEIESTDLLTVYSPLLVWQETVDPTDITSMTAHWEDNSLELVPQFGEKDFWYRLVCVDIHGNRSAPSASVAGRVPDTTPPGPTDVTGAEGYDDHITVYWVPNDEPDVVGYQLYRTACDFGKPYQPRKGQYGVAPGSAYLLAETEFQWGGCDFALVGEVTATDAENQLATTGRAYYEDYTVPEGSPLCYAYWVRAFDASGNVREGNAAVCPQLESEYVCQRLRERVPPPVPTIVGLKARSEKVIVEWASAPIQDLRAFHIYRSLREDDDPGFVASVDLDGVASPDKWEGTRPSCGEIPAAIDAAALILSFTDEGVDPKETYWYRVSALDWVGNESEGGSLRDIPAISTFTYTREEPRTPVVLPPVSEDVPAAGCGLIVRWAPTYDAALHRGFLVFRSTSSSGGYRQVSQIVQANEFEDRSAARGEEYWYRVQAMAPDGRLSEPSKPVRYSY
jgi:hypothetical protein